ncbi:unnamed protein product [Kuraishia capsulata CBS 1993]|uniref:Aldehyde dehydrogenase domain-containing protein n=1 Tax=Kuraishia capsulata CBS 1993 TaxID=1382522 RepID=W6MM70_9ASCO|nr:uncharacterized protein KUCA_T00003600001 [Kuraishia capsulata CBS 1993]CDK27621.1 unnamed protein product [Kuraishia capsulata CBS 1993]
MSIPLETTITLPNGKTYVQPTGLFINNEFVASIDKETLVSVNPATGEDIATVYAASEKDVDAAVKAGRECFENVWSSVSGTEKGKLMLKLVALMEKHAELLSDVEAMDSGKPRFTNAIYDINHCIDVVRYYAGWCDKSHGKQIPATEDKLIYTIHEPYGVCGQIIPWNYPLAMAIWKIAPAIASGNVVVMKSSENTPLSLYMLCNLVKEAGFPPGVINVITGLGRVCGSALASHLDVDKVSFTGSTLVGQTIQKLASANLKAVTMECGGKSALVVFDDARLDQAVKWAAFGIMYNMGQICTAASRVYVHSSIYDEFVSKLKAHVEEIYLQGDPFAENTQVGPQVSKVQQQRVLGYIESGKAEGATLVTGGGVPKGFNEKSCFVQPTIFADVTQSMKIVQEEIFGPVVVVSKFETEADALRLANDSSYGLGAYVFTENLRRAHVFARKVQSGQVWINCTNSSDFRAPFGGVKMSGFGRELGEYGLSMYTQSKAVHVNLTRDL